MSDQLPPELPPTPPSFPAISHEDQARQLLALREAALAISANLSLAETLKHIVMAAANLVDARYAALGVPDESGAYLAEFITTGLSAAAEARIGHRPSGHGIVGSVHYHEGIATDDL